MTIYIFIFSFILDSAIAYVIDASTDLPDWVDTTESIIDRDYLLNKDDNIGYKSDKPFSDEDLDDVLNKVIDDLNISNDITEDLDSNDNYGSDTSGTSTSNTGTNFEGSDNTNVSNDNIPSTSNKNTGIYSDSDSDTYDFKRTEIDLFALDEQNKNVQNKIDKELYSDTVYEEEDSNLKFHREQEVASYLAANSAIDVPLRPSLEEEEDEFLRALQELSYFNESRSDQSDSNLGINRNQSNSYTQYSDLDLSGLELDDSVYEFDNYVNDNDDDVE